MNRRDFLGAVFGLSLINLSEKNLDAAEKYAELSSGDYDLSPVIRNGKYGYIDTRTNKMVLDYQFDYAAGFSEGLALVSISRGSRHLRSAGYINQLGQLVIPFFNCCYASSFSEGFAYFSDYDGKYGFINCQGKNLIEPIFDEVNKFRNGFAMVMDNKKYGFINKSGYLLNGRCEFDIACDFNDKGTALVYIDDKFGYLKMSGEIDWTLR